MGGKKKKGSGNNLGRILIKDRFGQKQHQRRVDDSMLHTTEVQDGYDWGRLNLASVTEESSFQEFLRTAELAGTEFTAEKLNITFVNPKTTVGLLTKTEKIEIEKKHNENKELLKIPRRPKWTLETSAEELQQAENDKFLEWRRGLAMLQEDEQIVMTPYEKNLEFWRQLWRVVERSDVVIQIVDARNPLLFRSPDLEKYVKEVNPNKMNMILVNKSDLLTETQRQHWAEFFNKEGIRTAFFSAALAAEENIKQSESEEEEGEDAGDAAKGNTKQSKNKEEKEEGKENELSAEDIKKAVHVINDKLNSLEQNLTAFERIMKINSASESTSVRNSSKLLLREELISFLKSVYTGPKHNPNCTTIGLVGYPNVGKSSTINALMIEKKVSVSATPGKTKHFQTLFLDTDLMLCDCPGLVMPSFVLTKADMILNGILPIDQMRDFVPAVNLLCARIPRHVLEDKYGIIIAKPIEGEDPDRPPCAEELLLAYGYNRGFMTSNGQPDQSRSARYILKDYVSGKLLYSVAPPTVDQEVFHQFPPRTRRNITEQSLPKQQQRAMRINQNTSSTQLDKEFFHNSDSKVYVKGRANFPHIRVNQDGALSTEDVSAKPWRAVKKEKREKLRKKFQHLDQH